MRAGYRKPRAGSNFRSLARRHLSRPLKLGVVALVLFGAGAIYFGLVRPCCGAAQAPTALEAFVARQMRSLSVPANVRNLKNPLVSSPELLQHAARHFADHCANCHGNDGRGDTEIGRGLYPRAPNMQLAATQQLSDGELYYIIQNGVRWTGMPGWGEAGDHDDSWQLVLFIRHLPNLTEAEIRDMARFNPRSPAEIEEEREEQEFLKGATDNVGAKKK